MRRGSRSFTLLELLVVVGILATVGGALLVTLGGAEERARDDLTLRELAELKRAVLQLRADTGFLPKQGPLALGGAVPTPPQGAAWFDHPANLGQLFTNPFPTTNPSDPQFHALSVWDPGRRRGWRGPYLSRNAERQVEVRVPGLLSDPLPAAADRYAHHATPDDVYRWVKPDGQDVHPERKRARPYVLLDLDDPTRARVLGFGPNGVLDSPEPGPDMTLGTADDVLIAGDDVGIFLLR